MTKQTLILSLFLGLFPALAPAQPDRFRALDRNGDGFISSQEWYGKGTAPVPFTVVDLDGDGRISEGEFRDWSAARGGVAIKGVTSTDRFRSIDRNKDGFASPQEWNDGWLASVPFEEVDANKDGRISAREFSAWEKTRRAPAATTPRALPPGTAGTAEPRPSPPLVTAPRATTSQPALAPPPIATPSTSPGATPGSSSPSMTTGSGLTTK